MILKARATPHDRRGHPARQVFGQETCRPHRAAIAPGASRRRRRPLLAEAEHAREAAIADEQRRDGAAFDPLLEIAIGAARRQPARHDMTAAGAAGLLGEPARPLRWRLAGVLGWAMPSRSSAAKNIFRALMRLTVSASLPSSFQRLGDQPQQLGPILEAGAIDEAGNRRGGALGQRVERAAQASPLHPALDAAQLAAGMSRLLRVGVGEEIGDQRREAGAARRLRERPRRNRRDQQRGLLSLRVSGQERRRPGSRDRPAFRIRSSARTGRLRSCI